MDIFKDSRVSFDIAKLLRDKGFPQYLGEEGCVNTIPYYTQNGNLVTCDINTIRQRYVPEAAAPTIASVLKYIREHLGFYIVVDPRMQSTGTTAKLKRVMGYKCIVKMHNEPHKVVVGEYDKWAQAEEAGIKYILENFINRDEKFEDR